MSSSAVPSLPERMRVRRGSSAASVVGGEARELDVVRLLGAVRLVAHRERARHGGGDRLGQQEARQVAGADGVQRLARVLHERAALGVVEAVDRVAVEIDDPAAGGAGSCPQGIHAAMAYDVTMYLLFVDESGQLDQGGLFALGGIAVRDTSWADLRRLWQETLAAHDWPLDREIKWHHIRKGTVPPALADALFAMLAAAPVTALRHPARRGGRPRGPPASSSPPRRTPTPPA